MILLVSILIGSHSISNNVDWKVFGNDPGGSHYSTLAQINTQNVKSLKVAWTYHTKEKSKNVPIQCTPIVVEGIMYVVTAGHRVVALNPDTGAETWAYDSKS